MKKSVLTLVGVLMVVPGALAPRAQQGRLSGASPELAGQAVLSPTAHPPVPRDLSQLWLAPERGAAARSPSVASIGSAARLAADGEYNKALSLVSQPIAKDGPLGQYAAFYAGVAQLRLKRSSDALASFRSIQAQKPVGYLSEAAALGEADAQEALDTPSEAVLIYERLLKGRLSNVEDVYMRLGRAAKAANDPTKAAEAFSHVFYEFPLGENAASAGNELNILTGNQPLVPGSQRFKVELGRAERLFAGKQYRDARDAFESLHAVSSGDDKELMKLRLAECDYYMKRARSARDVLKSLSESSSRKAEALYFYGLTARELGDADAFVSALNRVETENPEPGWAEEALNVLGNFYLKVDEDARADAAFRELYARYPRGTYAERAAWKVGWTAYRAGQFSETVRVFERASADFSRSDFRPGWLYWAGRAHDALSESVLAQDRYTLAATDYANTYYGRLALKQLAPVAVARLASVRVEVEPAVTANNALPANGPMIRALLAAEMFDDALNELRYAQRVWGDSSAIEATVAWTRQQQARSEGGMKRLVLLRGAINTMRRAYPQFMAAGGDMLPREVLTVIYPIAYWDLIRKYADANSLDPYFVAALVAQESTFVADVKSGANAVGLMQLMPATARMYARKLNLKYSARLLTDPESNIRMGTAYLADKVREFGDLHLVLASYNAGERPVRRWQNERPGLQTEEFIDDIPYPETQNYVKKILGTADDYRRIYGTMQIIEGIDTTRKPVVQSIAAAPEKKAPAKAAPARRPAPRKPAARTR